MDAGRTRLIASDLDGTLLGLDSFVSASTAATLAAVADRGVELVACTGRGQYSARRRLEPIPAMRFAVFSNGSVVWDRTTDLAVRWSAFDRSSWGDLLAWLHREAPDAGFAWETPSGLASDQRWQELHDVAGSRWAPERAEEANDPVKVLVKHPEIHATVLSGLVAAAGIDAEVSTAGLEFVEITAAGVDKAHGLSWVCDHLGIGSDEVVAFGDEMNDLPMFDWVGHAVAMENAVEPVKVAADAHTGHHAEDGVSAYLLDHYPDPP